MAKRFIVLSPVRVGGRTVKPADDGSAVVELNERDAADLLKLGVVEPAPVVRTAPAPSTPPASAPAKPRRTRTSAPKQPTPATTPPATETPSAPDAPATPETPAVGDTTPEA